MTNTHERFKRQTEDAIIACADYLRDNAGALADQFCAMPSKEWWIQFRAGEDGAFPWVEVHTKQHNADVIRPYGTSEPERF